MTPSISTDVQLLTRPEGRISYTVTGVGPLIVAVPGMGDLRSTYRELTGPLVDAGFRVAVLDLRGHGDSDTAFRTHGDEATASDMLALIDELGGPAVIVGNSMAGSAAVIAAADRPDAVAGLVLLSPFLRQPGSPGALPFVRAMYRVMISRPWGSRFWTGYYDKTLNRGARGPHLTEQIAAIRESMSHPERLAQFRRLAMQLDHRVVEPKVAHVSAPSLTVIGSVDPDFTDPAAELAFVADALHGETLLLDDVAHYPQLARPELLVPRVLAFVGGLRDGAGWTASHA